MKLYKSLFTIACLTCFCNNLGFSMEMLDKAPIKKPSQTAANLTQNQENKDLVFLGKFAIDSQGFLINRDTQQYLIGNPLNRRGNKIPQPCQQSFGLENILSSYQHINVLKPDFLYKSTSKISIAANLPSEENSFGYQSKREAKVPLIDSLGTLRELTFSFQRIGPTYPLSWSLSIKGPSEKDIISRKDFGGNNVSIDEQNPITIEFHRTGVPSKYDDVIHLHMSWMPIPHPITLFIIWDENASAACCQNIELDLGNLGSKLGLCCLAEPYKLRSITQDGIPYSEWNGIVIDQDTVKIKFAASNKSIIERNYYPEYTQTSAVAAFYELPIYEMLTITHNNVKDYASTNKTPASKKHYDPNRYANYGVID